MEFGKFIGMMFAMTAEIYEASQFIKFILIMCAFLTICQIGRIFYGIYKWIKK